MNHPLWPAAQHDVSALMEQSSCIIVALGVAFVLSACTSVPYAHDTAYPGSAFGKIEIRSQYGGTDPSVNPATVPVLVPAGKTLVLIDLPVTPVAPIRHHYQIRSPDGTLHIVSTELDFPVGSCVAWSGYADGPSRTHWSMGRVEVMRSDKCER